MTLDTWVTGWRPRDLATSNFPQLRGHRPANYFSDPRFAKLIGGPLGKDPRAAVATWAAIFGNPLTWDDLPWLRLPTKLPLIVKGICHPDDARRAIDDGIDGRYCSNHGGRQANGGIPALDMLPAVVKAAGSVPVMLIRESAPGPTSSRLSRCAAAVGSAALTPTGWRWAGPTKSSSAAVSARRSRSPDGGRRISDPRRPQAGDVAAPRAMTKARASFS